VGRVISAYVADEFVQDAARCHINTEDLKLIARMHGGGWYARSPDLFQMERPSWPAAHRPMDFASRPEG